MSTMLILLAILSVLLPQISAVDYKVKIPNDDLTRILKEVCGSARFMLENVKSNQLKPPYKLSVGTSLKITCSGQPSPSPPSLPKCTPSDAACDPSGLKCDNSFSGITYKLEPDTRIQICNPFDTMSGILTQCECANLCSKNTKCQAAVFTSNTCILCYNSLFSEETDQPGFILMRKNVSS